MAIIGVILLIVAGICLWVWRRRQTTLTTIGSTVLGSQFSVLGPQFSQRREGSLLENGYSYPVA
jgi:hypothetical protein